MSNPWDTTAGAEEQYANYDQYGQQQQGGYPQQGGGGGYPDDDADVGDAARARARWWGLLFLLFHVARGCSPTWCPRRGAVSTALFAVVLKYILSEDAILC